MRAARGWALAFALAGLSVDAAPKRRASPRAMRVEPAPKRVRGVVQVAYVTSTRAYLDRGSTDGLVVGESLKLTRQGHAVGTCEVDAVSLHSATCEGQGFQVADRAPTEQTAPPERPRLPPPLVSGEELARRRTMVDGAELSRVDFKARARALAAGASLARGSLTQSVWASVDSAAGPFQQTRADLGVNGVEVGLGFRAWADLTVLAWERRPAGFRALSTAAAQLYVREAEVALRAPARSLALAIGRTAPRYAPGLVVLDGAQGGWRSGETEAGLYAGAVPDAVSLAPRPSQWAVGAYLTRRAVFENGELQPEARLGLASGVSGSRLEAEVAAHGWAGKGFDGHLQARLATGLGGGAATARGLVELVRLDLNTLPAPKLRLQGGLRYDWTGGPDVGVLGSPVFGARGLHADVSGAYEAAGGFTVGAQGGLARDLSGGLWRGYVGPELGFPTALGRYGAVSLGYQEELGWMSGRSAYLQAAAFPDPRVRLLVRGSFFMESPQAGAEGFASQEVGLYTGLDVKLLRWLWVRGALLGRLGLPAGDAGLPAPAGMTASLQLGGEL